MSTNVDIWSIRVWRMRRRRRNSVYYVRECVTIPHPHVYYSVGPSLSRSYPLCVFPWLPSTDFQVSILVNENGIFLILGSGTSNRPLVLFSVFDINDIKPLVFLFCIWGIYQFVISLVCKLSNSSWNRTEPLPYNLHPPNTNQCTMTIKCTKTKTKS